MFVFARLWCSIMLLAPALLSGAELLAPLAAHPRQPIGALIAACRQGDVDSLMHADASWWHQPIG
ncbi:MAG: hypothetical protein ACOCXA_02975, partial [Planctomycetota bacterium]